MIFEEINKQALTFWFFAFVCLSFAFFEAKACLPVVCYSLKLYIFLLSTGGFLILTHLELRKSQKTENKKEAK